MDHLEMVEKLREKANVSYEEARTALEASDWDLLDALVLLESEGKTGTRTASDFTTRAAQEEAPRPEKKEEFDLRGALRKLLCALRKLIRKGNANTFAVIRKEEEIVAVPVTVLAALLIFVWPFSSIVLIVGLFLGCRYRFSGPDISRKVNDVMDQAADAVQKDQ